MRNLNVALYIEDIRPDRNDITTDFGWLVAKINGYTSGEIGAVMLEGLVGGDCVATITGRRWGQTLHCLSWGVVQENPRWEGPMVEILGSFRINDVIRKYARLKEWGTPPTAGADGLFPPETVLVNGKLYVMRGDGYLMSDGKPILRVITSAPIPTCLRLVGTAQGCYSFTHEIPVRALDGSDMHEINYQEFGRMIRNVVSVPWLNMRTKFNLVIGIRRWAREYAQVYGIEDLKMTEAEVSKLASNALFGGGVDVEHITRMYREIYNLNQDEPLPGLDQDSLNAVSKSQA